MKNLIRVMLYGMGTVLFAAALSFFVDFSYFSLRMENFLVNVGIVGFDEGIDKEQRARVNAVYSPNFLFARSRVKSLMTYIPVFEVNDLDTARMFAAKFEMPECSVTETDYAFMFQNGGGSLTVYKYLNYVVFLEAGIAGEACNNGERGVINSVDDVVGIAERFIRERQLAVNHHDVIVTESGGRFVVSFIEKLSGLPNYAFPTVVELDAFGTVLSAEHYFFEFERLAACNLKTMRQAYYELPVDFPDGTRINLTRATLVYFFENSILQPAFLFEGQFENGAAFRAFVNAALFGERRTAIS